MRILDDKDIVKYVAQQRYLEAKALYHPTAPERCYVT